jgi:hypothetical protein
MGIDKEFRFGIKLYCFSFSYSNLNMKEDVIEKENERITNNFKFLDTISKEIFNIRLKNRVTKPKRLINDWAFICL